MDMRGLSVFISEIRKCTTKEEEQQKVDKELAKIRSKFKQPSLKGYDRKKYVCKLLYIYMLGYEIDFGHIEAVNLLSSEKYSEKHTGYLACTLLLHENHELVTLITNSIKRDLNSKANPDEQCLALTALANIGGKEQAEALNQDVAKLLVGESKQIVRKKAALTMLTMYRRYPELYPSDQWAGRLVSFLGEKVRDLGVITSALSLIIAFVALDPTPFIEAVPRAIKMLYKLVISREYSSNYLYYGIPAPWLQIKLLRLLQYFDPPVDTALSAQLTQVLQRTIAQAERIKSDKSNKSVTRVNAAHAVLFEALNLAIQYDQDEAMLTNVSSILARFLEDKDPNLRYLALDTMARLAFSNHKDVKTSMIKVQGTILLALKDPDISIRRRALDLLYSMCNNDNASQIVGELLAYLPLSNYEIREELVLKVAILAEKFAEDFSWYVDVILNLITQSGDFVSDEIWHRVVQIVTNRDEELQKYTAKTVLAAVSSPSAHEKAVLVAGYILGEFGFLVENETPGSKQFEVLHSKFDTVSLTTKILLLNTYLKFYNLYEDGTLRDKIRQVFEAHRNYIDAEMQQRANEYFNIANLNNSKILGAVLQNMPPFPERESSVMKKILERQTNKASRAVKTEKQPEPSERDEPADTKDVPLPSEQPAPERNMLDDVLETDNQKADDGLDFVLDVTSAPKPVKPAPVQQLTDDNILDFTSEPAPQPTSTNIANEAASLGAQKSAVRQQTGSSVEAMMNANKPDDEELLRLAHVQAEKNFQQLLIKSEGTAIEDAHLQVDVTSEFHHQKGKMIIAYGNKTDSAINKLRVTIKNIPQLDVQMTQVAPLLAPNAQASQMISINCLQPFVDTIGIALFFEADKKTFKFDIKLPVAVNKFVEPLDIPDREAFFLRWKSIQQGLPLEHQEILKPASGQISVDSAKSILTSGFRLALLSNIEKNPLNLVAAGEFNCEQAPQGVLVRLECNTNVQAYRLTVRSTNAIVANQMFSLMKQQLQAI